MNEKDKIYELIKNFNSDKSVIELKNYYKSLSFMEILGVDRSEIHHSSFLKWLFDAKHNFDLDTKPLLLFLNLLLKESKDKKIIDDIDRINLKNSNLVFEEIENEYPLGKKQKYGRCDIYISFSIDNSQYAIVLENKIYSHEIEDKEKGEHQTTRYYNYFSGLDYDIKYIYVFLAPIFDNKKSEAYDKHFINISYDDIVNYVINPLLNDNLEKTTRFFLLDYLKVLSKPNVIMPNSKSISLLSNYDSFEFKLIKTIADKHSELGKLLKNGLIENEVVEGFLNNDLNEMISASVWPEIMKKHNRNRNVSFEELGIESGTILYLAMGEKQNVRKSNDLYVTTLDSKSKVQYKLKGKMRIKPLSVAAQELTGLKYGLRGINWFIYNYKGKDINLFNYYENLKEKQ